MNTNFPHSSRSHTIVDRRSTAMAERLTTRLTELEQAAHRGDGANLSGLDWNMTPQLAYGRHRGPARLKSRQAAVAVGLFFDPQLGWLFPLTRRAHALRHHGGQICFPGGRVEGVETPPQAAIREFEEELGQPADVIKICGHLPPQYVYASDNAVTPVVCVLGKPPKPWTPDPGEVDEVIHLPLTLVLQQSHQTRAMWHQRTIHAAEDPEREVAQFHFSAPAYEYRNERIWGATAVILDQLAQCLLVMGRRLERDPALPNWLNRYPCTSDAASA